MTYVPNTCPECGASLDPGERCDCESTRAPNADQADAPSE